jgi:prevent-host-death family protein
VEVKDALEIHLRHAPTKVTKSRIKRLRGMSQPQFRLRVGDIRGFMTLQERRPKSSPSSRKKKRKPGSTKKARQRRAVALAEVKDDLSKYLRLAAEEEIIITRHGRPAGVLIGFDSEDDWFEYRLEHHPEFLRRIAESRVALREGRGVRLEDL